MKLGLQLVLLKTQPSSVLADIQYQRQGFLLSVLQFVHLLYVTFRVPAPRILKHCELKSSGQRLTSLNGKTMKKAFIFIFLVFHEFKKKYFDFQIFGIFYYFKYQGYYYTPNIAQNSIKSLFLATAMRRSQGKACTAGCPFQSIIL